MVDNENVCRLCLHSTGAMSDIFSTYEGKSMQQQIQRITGLNIRKGDGYPSTVCHRCRHIVELGCELRETAAKSHAVLIKAAHDGEGDSDEDADGETDYIEDPSDKACQGRGQNRPKTKDGDDRNDDNNDMDDDSDSYYEEDAEESIPDPDEAEASVGTSQANFKDTYDNAENAERNEDNVKNKFPNGKPPMYLTCQLCLKVMESEEMVRVHVEKHYEGSDLTNYLDITKRPFICTECDEVQLNKPQLVKHHRRHLAVNPYTCRHPGCNYAGKDRDGLRHHVVSHRAARRLCSICGAAFRRRFEMLQHLEAVHAAPGRGRVCHTCGWRSRCVEVLAAHMRAHHFAPRYSCPYGSCERTYRSLRALRDHEFAHRAGKRVFRCRLCGAHAFPSTSLLKRHMLTHDGSNLRRCPRCPAAFEQPPAFEAHYRAHHAHPARTAQPAPNQDLGYQSETEEISEQNERDETAEQNQQHIEKLCVPDTADREPGEVKYQDVA